MLHVFNKLCCLIVPLPTKLRILLQLGAFLFTEYSLLNEMMYSPKSRGGKQCGTDKIERSEGSYCAQQVSQLASYVCSPSSSASVHCATVRLESHVP